MAKIVRFIELPVRERERATTDIDCGYRVSTMDGQRVLHLETYGSRDREIPGKVSQSIQIDEVSARRLIESIWEAFPALNPS